MIKFNFILHRCWNKFQSLYKEEIMSTQRAGRCYTFGYHFVVCYFGLRSETTEIV